MAVESIPDGVTSPIRPESRSSRPWLDPVRLGGMAGLLVVCLAVALNLFVIDAAPAFDAPASEIRAYVSAQGQGLEISDTMRFVVAILVPLFGVGIHGWVGRSAGEAHRTWAMFGLVGAVWISAVGTVANSLEVAGVWQLQGFPDEPLPLRSIWGFGSALFIAASLGWGTLVLGFSLAAHLAGVTPRWLTWLGLLTAAACYTGGVGVASVLDGGWAQVPWFSSTLLFSIWVIGMSVVMIRSS